jgi:hypothetical protein
VVPISSATLFCRRIEHREAGGASAYRHLILQHVPVFDEFATLDPEEADGF